MLAAFEDILIEVLAYINAVAVKVCVMAVDTLCMIVFIEPKDVDFSSRATN